MTERIELYEGACPECGQMFHEEPLLSLYATFAKHCKRFGGHAGLGPADIQDKKQRGYVERQPSLVAIGAEVPE